MDDLLDRMRKNPAAGWRIADVARLCKSYGVKCEPPRGCGSHYKVLREGHREILTIPFKRPAPRAYRRKIAI